MLAVWKEWGLDELLREAYQNNIIMSGVSAGAICWFDQGITDSWKDRQAIIDCMGFVSGVCCPHYDEEPERIPFVKKVLIDKSINECIAIEGYAALHYINDKPEYIVSFGKKTTAHKVILSGNKILHETFNNINKVKL
jgi:aminopeptidase N